MAVAPLAGAWIETPWRACRGRRSTSPPSRGRGSKPVSTGLRRSFRGVAPLAGAWIETSRRMTGMKLRGKSPPSRGRGSKQRRSDHRRVELRVAPLAGAWIETCRPAPSSTRRTVAPLAGAWIETSVHHMPPRSRCCRPPRGGVDRNRSMSARARQSRPSRPPRGGVDRNVYFGQVDPTKGESPPSRGRGSKPCGPAGRTARGAVAPLAGAWIETRARQTCASPARVAPLAGAWIETRQSLVIPTLTWSRPPRGGVDRNITQRAPGR